MKNFKQIAEDCLAGKLSGTFVLRNTDQVKSSDIVRKSSLTCSYWNRLYGFFSDSGHCYNASKHWSEYDVITFIPDMKKEQITIDVPEGKVPVMEQTESGVVITWKEKELTYEEIINEIVGSPKHIIGFSYGAINDTTSSSPFYRKVEALRKLTNIRNYFGKPKHFCDGVVIKCVNSYCGVETGQFYFDKSDLDSLHEVVFAKQEHAEQAIKMLGDELKCLFEPW